jgi:protein farnesyltransferase/geranylgeranyltransferase type-1 subunit alpha
MSSEEEEEEYVLYRDRPEWKDVAPVPQDDGPHPVVAIAYTEKFRDAHDYFRAVVKSNEMSERVLELTTTALELNAANYTIWHHRRQVLQSIKKDLRQEMQYVATIIEDEPKNYQVWYHRQKLVEWSGDPSGELEFTAKALRTDSKNYHAWQYRQWLIKTYSLWEEELSYVDQLLGEDLRNNSVWNQRHFVVSGTTGFTDEVVSREIEYAMKYIRKAPNNESSWNYLHGVLRGRRYSDHPGVVAACEEMLGSHVYSPFLLALLVDVYEEDGGREKRDEAVKLCRLLAEKVDTIRKTYWDYEAKRLLQPHPSRDSAHS